MPRGKNLRLSYTTWQELRRLKFRLGASTYSEVLEKVFNLYDKPFSDDIRVKPPTDMGDVADHSDKTIVISPELHKRLHDIKNEYMLSKGYSSRGPSAVSISDILFELLIQFKSRLG